MPHFLLENSIQYSVFRIQCSGFRIQRLLVSGVTEATGAAFGVGEGGDLNDLGLFVAGDNHLADTLTRLDGLRFATEVDENDAYLAAVVGIDRSRGIEHGQPALERHAATRTDLRLVTGRQFDEQTCRDEPALEGLERHRLGEMTTDIHSGSQRTLVARQRIIALVDDSKFHR